MAKCKNCPALKDDGIGVIEYYAFGPGCPDQDFDTYGGDCHQVNFPDEGIDEDEYQQDIMYDEMIRTYEDDGIIVR